jgi:hypothetical protein
MQSISDLNSATMQQSIVIGDPLRPEGAEEYKEHAYELDVSFRWASKHPHARFCDTEALFSYGDHSSDAFTRWNLHEWIGSTHWVVGYTAPNDDLTFGLSVHPWPDRGPLSTDSKQLFKLLFEHMERALRLHAQPPQLVGRGKPQILVDRRGRVRSMNLSARELVEMEDGLSVWDDQLHGATSSVTARLNDAIKSAVSALIDGGYGGAVSLPRPSGKTDLRVTVVPFLIPPSPFDEFRPAAIVQVVLDGSTQPCTVELWRQLFGLTSSEASFAEALSSNDFNLRDDAEKTGVTYATARVHLKHLLEKTETHSQAQLSRLLTRLEP